MKIAFASLLVAAVAACGGAAPAPAAPAAAASPGLDAAPGAPAGPCVAAMIEVRPKAPVEEVGTMNVRGLAPDCRIEAKGKGGAVTKTPIDCKGGKDVRDAMQKAVCSLGGDVFWLAGAAPSDANPVADFSVGRYTKPDEAADLKLVCAPFAALPLPDGKTLDPSSLDDSQRAHVRVMILEQTLTSRKWRLWLHDFPNARDAAIATLRDAAKKAGMGCDAEWVK